MPTISSPDCATSKPKSGASPKPSRSNCSGEVSTCSRACRDEWKSNRSYAFYLGVQGRTRPSQLNPPFPNLRRPLEKVFPVGDKRPFCAKKTFPCGQRFLGASLKSLLPKPFHEQTLRLAGRRHNLRSSSRLNLRLRWRYNCLNEKSTRHRSSHRTPSPPLFR